MGDIYKGLGSVVWEYMTCRRRGGALASRIRTTRAVGEQASLTRTHMNVGSGRAGSRPSSYRLSTLWQSL